MPSKNLYENRKSLGLCVSCGKMAPKIDRMSCEHCLTKTAERSAKAKNVYLNTAGRCANCGQTATTRYCNTCKSSRNERIRKQYVERLLNGLCGKCGSKNTNDNKRCETCLQKQRDFRKNKKIQVFKAYGGIKCNCCGETTLEFLTMDHINNNGAEHRREITGSGRGAGGSAMYLWLIKNNFPEGFQVLCANCQLGKAINNGTCPHKQ